MIEARKNSAFERLFLAYLKASLRKHFAGVHVGGTESFARIDRSRPLILYGNHSNWWDGLIAFFLSQTVLHVDSYMMMEERQLRRYMFFRRLGAFSVVRESPRQAFESMRYASSLLLKPNTGVWIYPQGVMVPNDVRPLKFFQGVARLAAMHDDVQLVPVALRYEFLMEQRPEAFALIGESGMPAGKLGPAELTAELEKRLTALLDKLRSVVTKGELQGFTRLLSGRASVNTLHDRYRLAHESA